MSAYEKIKNPETGRYVSIYGKLGQKVLANYIEAHQYGGKGKDQTSPPHTQQVDEVAKRTREVQAECLKRLRALEKKKKV